MLSKLFSSLFLQLKLNYNNKLESNEVHSHETEVKDRRLDEKKELNQLNIREAEENLKLTEEKKEENVESQNESNKSNEESNTNIESSEVLDIGAEESKGIVFEPMKKATELIMENETELDHFLENTKIDSKEVQIEDDNLLDLMKDEIHNDYLLPVETEKEHDEENETTKKIQMTGKEDNAIHVIRDVEEMSGFKEQEIVI